MYFAQLERSESEAARVGEVDESERHLLTPKSKCEADLGALPARQPVQRRLFAALVIALGIAVVANCSGSGLRILDSRRLPTHPAARSEDLVLLSASTPVTCWETSQKGGRLKRKPNLELVADNFTVDGAVVEVHPGLTGQELVGFGGAFTEAASVTFSKLNGHLQDEIIQKYFSDEGLAYILGRVHINSCDFSEDSYSFDDHEDDMDLQMFDHGVNHDMQNSLLPLIGRAQAMAAARGSFLRLVASPWSPPAWMKKNGKMAGSSSPCFADKYASVWAKYIATWVSAYEGHGVHIWGVTVQNEPSGNWSFESCLLSAQEEADFLAKHLGPTLRRFYPSVKILIFDDNKNGMMEFVNTVTADRAALPFVDGVAFHWYAGDHFDTVKQVHKEHGNLILLGSEATYDKWGHGFDGDDTWAFGQGYAHDIIGDLNSGASGWIDWNLLLDDAGGPNHVSNWCKAAMMASLPLQSLTVLPQYYFVGHFSKFMPPGSKHVATEVAPALVSRGRKHKYGTCTAANGLQATSVLRPDQQLAIVLLNCGDKGLDFKLKVGDQALKAEIPPRAIQTYLIPTAQVAATPPPSGSGCDCKPGHSTSMQAGPTGCSCVPEPCPENSDGVNLPSGCTCRAGYSGSILAQSAHPFYSGSCTPAPCPLDSLGQDIASTCTCKAGFRGAITPSTAYPYYTGGCEAVACPENSDGGNVPMGCTCRAGFSGIIEGSAEAPFYKGGCAAEPCPLHAAGSGIPSGCACEDGYAGGIEALQEYPYYRGSCLPVLCPQGSEGSNLPSGCKCKDGFSGVISASSVFPYYLGDCNAVLCPAHSKGTDVVSGCTCEEGFAGSIEAASSPPFYTGSCRARPCPENSEGVSLPSGCSCKPGFRGGIKATSFHPFFTGDCVPVPCPASAVGHDIPAGCTCQEGFSGRISAAKGEPFYEGSCEPETK